MEYMPRLIDYIASLIIISPVYINNAVIAFAYIDQSPGRIDFSTPYHKYI